MAKRKPKRGGWVREGVKVREKVKGSGIWWVFVNNGGQRKAYCKGAEEIADAFANELRAGFKLVEARNRGLTTDELQRIGLAQAEPSASNDGVTFAVYAQRVLDRWEPREDDPEHGLKFSTWRDYRQCLNARLIPEIGTRPIGGLRRRDARALEEALRDAGLKAPNIRKHVRVVSSILSEAVDDELIPSNPMLGAGRKRRRSKAKQAHRRQDPFTREELAALLEAAADEVGKRKSRGMVVYPFRPFIPLLLCLAHTGVRWGEAIALQWGDIDWRSSTILVRRAFSHGRLDVPKGGKARKVEMTTRLQSALREVYEQRFDRVAALDAERQAGMNAEVAERAREARLFTDELGGFLSVSNVRRRVWAPLLAAADLRYRRLHDLRHTFATVHLQGGTDPIWVSTQLGHHSVAFTLATYAHLPLGDRGGHADRIELRPNATEMQPKTGITFQTPHTSPRKPRPATSFEGAPGVIRTPDLLVRSQLL
jgi:integrase